MVRCKAYSKYGPQITCWKEDRAFFRKGGFSFLLRRRFTHKLNLFQGFIWGRPNWQKLFDCEEVIGIFWGVWVANQEIQTKKHTKKRGKAYLWSPSGTLQFLNRTNRQKRRGEIELCYSLSFSGEWLLEWMFEWLPNRMIACNKKKQVSLYQLEVRSRSRKVRVTHKNLCKAQSRLKTVNLELFLCNNTTWM